jgi:phosphoglycolate phosphatase
LSIPQPAPDGDRLEIVLFDLDGTLTDSQAGIVNSYRHALSLLGLPVDEEAIRRWIGPPLRDGLAALGVPDRLLDTAIITYRAYFVETGMFQNRLYDGVAQALADLRGAGITLGVATSKLDEFAVEILDHFGITKKFAVIAGASRDGRRTHKGDVVDHALDCLGRPDPRTVALVGDREHDVHAATEHGLLPIGASWGYGSAGELTAAGVKHIVSSPSELTRLVLATSPAR